MAYKNLNAVNIVNVINQQVNKQYGTTFPAITKDKFSSMADQLRYAAPNIVNAWQDELVNLVGMQLSANKRAFESYFRKLHLGETTTENIQRLMMDLIAARTFSPDADADSFFEDDKVDVGVQYMTSMVKTYFPVSINEDTLNASFVSQEAFMNYFLNVVDTQLYSSLEMFDTTTVKELIAQNVREGNFYLYPVAKVVDQATALAFTAKLKGIAADMSVEYANKYNLAGFNTWTPRDEGIIITDTDTEAVTETYSLAWAFNKEFLSLQQGGQAITMANNSILNGAVFALYGDRYAFQIRNKTGFPKTASQYFGNTLTLKRWLHYQALYAVSYFNNMVAFADQSKISSSVTATLATRSGNSGLNKGAKDQIYVSALTISDNGIFDKFGTYAITGANSSDTVIDENSGKIVIGKDETATSITVTFTSHLDADVTATLQLTINS